MPISTRPGKQFPVYLNSDMDDPKEIRRTFFAKSQTMEGHEQILEVIDCKYEDKITVKEVFDRTCEKLNEVIVGWENVGHEFGSISYKKLLSYDEAVELLRKIGRNSHIEPEEKKS